MSSPATYVNPVHPGSFADPFVLRLADGTYAAYGTGSVIGGRVFEVLRSPDLVTWTSVGGALEPLGVDWAQDYWAPEVAHGDGRYFMYYSAGRGDAGHLLRVATADAPEGPFRDEGVVLTPDERFAIDPHPFCDADGQWWLFYAHDVLEEPRAGTTIAVDRLTDMTHLAGEPRTILRASGDWQLFLREREMYGKVWDWHTLEGPFVVPRDGRLYLTYSGGNWEQPSYGLSYAVADHPLGPWTEPVPGPAILQTRPGEVLGPGHASVVKDGAGTDWLAYHAWDAARTKRRFCLDELAWGPDGPERSGPSTGPQRVPGFPGQE